MVVVWAVSVGGAEVWAGVVRWEDEDGRAGAGGVVRVHPFLSGIEEEERRGGIYNGMQAVTGKI